MLEKMEREIKGLREGIKEYLARVNDGDLENAAFHLEAADSLLENAARLQVLNQVHAALTKPGSKATIQTIMEHAQREALTGARFPRRSSSQSSSLIYAYKVATWADLIDPISGLLRAGLEK